MNDIIGGNNVGRNSFGSTITFDTLNNRVFNHEVFGITKRFTIAPGEFADILIDPTENGPFPKRTFVVLPAKIKAKGAGPVYIDMYVNPIVTAATGAILVPLDRNFDSAVTPHTVVRLNPTVTNVGTKAPFEDSIESANGQGNTADVGGEIKDDFIIVPSKTIKYMIRLSNTDTTSTARCVFALNYYEV